MGGKGKGTRDGERYIWKFVRGQEEEAKDYLWMEETDVAHRIMAAYKGIRR